MVETISINIPRSAGTAIGLASGVSIYSAAIVSDAFKLNFLNMTAIFIIATIAIELMHVTIDGVISNYA